MKIFILHLSDFHIETTDEVNDLSKEICTPLQNVASDCDYAIAVVTGDLSATGSSEEFIKVNALFSEIKNIFLSPVINKDIHFITVPGNHDCNLRNISPTRLEVIKKAIENPNDINLIDESAVIQSEYFDFAHLINDEWITHKLGKTKKVKFGDYQVTFHGYNTAWMYSPDQEQGSLYFPIECAKNHIDSATSNLTLSLLHHPLEWFISENGRLFREYLTKTSDIVLTGHIHQMGKRLEDDLDYKPTLYIEGGKIKDKKDVDNCGFISLIIDTCSLNHRILQYKWNIDRFKLVHENYLNQQRL
jgi:predicted MPP superfamily phosphohydrolase